MIPTPLPWTRTPSTRPGFPKPPHVMGLERCHHQNLGHIKVLLCICTSSFAWKLLLRREIPLPNIFICPLGWYTLMLPYHLLHLWQKGLYWSQLCMVFMEEGRQLHDLANAETQLHFFLACRPGDDASI